ncbi:MAG: methyltransferase domain-containing protein [Anaerolineae bacterium]|jgi:ubiquinone/menaquinone biosynthesis C-methylase UbiE
MPDRTTTFTDHDPHNGYYAGVSQAFDRAAQNYDALYQANPVMAWMRSESLTALLTAFVPGSRLLEIGCGTGDEAIALSRAGYRIVATDISAGMIDAARTKAQTLDPGEVTWRVLAAGRLVELLGEYGPGSFDGAYASFGALNCEPELAPVFDALARLLRPGAALVCSVMNRWCAWEIGWELLHLHPRQAFRRLGKGWLTAGLASPGGSQPVPVLYYTPRGLERAFAPQFRTQAVFGLPVFLPPPYLAHLLDRHPALFSRLQRFERFLRDRFPFHALGDHFLLVAIRTGQAPASSQERR